MRAGSLQGVEMYETIVVGTDGSPTATAALHQSVALAKLTGATLHLVHAYQLASAALATAGPTSLTTPDVVGLNEGIRIEGDRVMTEAVAAASAAGVKSESHLSPGEPADA